MKFGSEVHFNPGWGSRKQPTSWKDSFMPVRTSWRSGCWSTDVWFTIGIQVVVPSRNINVCSQVARFVGEIRFVVQRGETFWIPITFLGHENPSIQLFTIINTIIKGIINENDCKTIHVVAYYILLHLGLQFSQIFHFTSDNKPLCLPVVLFLAVFDRHLHHTRIREDMASHAPRIPDAGGEEIKPCDVTLPNGTLSRHTLHPG